jgi:hypothetical protein
VHAFARFERLVLRIDQNPAELATTTRLAKKGGPHRVTRPNGSVVIDR